MSQDRLIHTEYKIKNRSRNDDYEGYRREWTFSLHVNFKCFKYSGKETVTESSKIGHVLCAHCMSRIKETIVKRN